MYNFNVEKAVDGCVEWIKDWFDKNGKGCNVIIGISGDRKSVV